MIRTASSLPLLLGGATTHPAMPDVIEGGRVAAQLSDWQTMAYFMMILIAAQAIERIISGFQARSTAKLLAAAMDRLAEASAARGENISSTLMLLQSGQADIKAELRRAAP